MDSINKQVYIEEQYPGVTLGVIDHPRGLIQIDAPPSLLTYLQSQLFAIPLYGVPVDS